MPTATIQRCLTVIHSRARWRLECEHCYRAVPTGNGIRARTSPLSEAR
jgi:hypothetical protein